MKYKILVGIIAAVFLLGVAGSAVVLLSPGKDTVEIVSDGEVVYSADLRDAGDAVFEIEYDGRTNTIEIQDGRIRVKDAQCPDRTCVHMGWLRGEGMPIVCLPNHLVIRYEGDGAVDAVTG